MGRRRIRRERTRFAAASSRLRARMSSRATYKAPRPHYGVNSREQEMAIG
jgi:hypothetical protein